MSNMTPESLQKVANEMYQERTERMEMISPLREQLAHGFEPTAELLVSVLNGVRESTNRWGISAEEEAAIPNNKELHKCLLTLFADPLAFKPSQWGTVMVLEKTEEGEYSDSDNELEKGGSAAGARHKHSNNASTSVEAHVYLRTLFFPDFHALEKCLLEVKSDRPFYGPHIDTILDYDRSRTDRDGPRCLSHGTMTVDGKLIKREIETRLRVPPPSSTTS
jgi:hypothetical protein